MFSKMSEMSEMIFKKVITFVYHLFKVESIRFSWNKTPFLTLFMVCRFSSITNQCIDIQLVAGSALMFGIVPLSISASLFIVNVQYQLF